MHYLLFNLGLIEELKSYPCDFAFKIMKTLDTMLEAEAHGHNQRLASGKTECENEPH